MEVEGLVHPRIEAALNLLDVWLDANRAYNSIPGVACGVVLDDKLIWSGGYGFANVAEEKAIDMDTIFSICSISKLFTSIALMQLRDQGKLSLSDAVSDHLPWFTLKKIVHDQAPITIEMLLTHSAGLPREVADAAYWSPPDFEFPTRDEFVDKLKGQTTLYESGTYWQYSNLGLSLVGEIVSVVAGVPFTEYVTEHILTPLGLSDTRPYFPTDLHGKRMAIGYGAKTRDGTRPVLPPFDTKGVCPAAGFTSTVRDLAKFAGWHHHTLSGTDATGVLKRATLKDMIRVHWVEPSFDHYWGLGYSVAKVRDGTVVGHEGGCPGYSTQFSIVPKTGLGVIVMVNSPGVAASITETVIRIMSKALSQSKDSARWAKFTQEDLPDFSHVCGIYDAQPWANEVAVAQNMDKLNIMFLGPPATGPQYEKLRFISSSDKIDIFRVERGHDQGLGEQITFNKDSSKKVVSKVRHGQIAAKLSDAKRRPVVPVTGLATLAKSRL